MNNIQKRAKGLFITATGTSVGKTVVSAVLARLLCQSGSSVIYYKPVQSGALVDSRGERYASDCRFVEMVAGCTTANSLLYDKPASPHLAAELAGETISLDRLVDDYNRFVTGNDYILVEGAGGMFVPLDRSGTVISDLAVRLQLPVVLVAPAGLGSINTVSLSILYAKSIGLTIQAVLLIYGDEEPTDIENDNRLVLQQMSGIKNILLIPSAAEVDTDACQPGSINRVVDSYPKIDVIRTWFYE